MLLFTGCSGKKSGKDDTGGQGGAAAGADASEGSPTSGIEADGLYDIELTEEAIASPLQEGESFLGAQYFNGERIWFIGNEEGQVFCYYEEKNEREMLLENVSAAYLVGYTWYRDTEYFYVYRRNVLAVLRSDGEEAYTLRLEGTIVDICMTKEGDIALVEDCGVEGEELKILDRESGEKIWYVKWNGTSYRPGMTGGTLLTFKRTEEGMVKQLIEEGGAFREEGLKQLSAEKMGKVPLVFKVLYANEGLKLLVTKFNQEYHVFLQDRGEEYGWEFQERNGMEIATGKEPDLLAEDAVSDIYGLAQKGALENLEPYFAQGEVDKTAYYVAAFQSLGREGIYGMGYEMEANTLYMKEELIGDDMETLLHNMERYDRQEVFSAIYNYTANKLLGYFFKCLMIFTAW